MTPAARRSFLVFLLAAALFGADNAAATTVLPSTSVYTDFKARNVGDVVTILIVESTSASKSAGTDTESRMSSDIFSAGGFDFIDFWNLSVDNASQGGGTTHREGSLTARITANVVEVDPNGLLVIEGTRAVRVNGEEERIVLRGRLRTNDIRPDNTVYSTFLADAAIEFTGHGSLNNASEPGILTRILNWLF
jgi:flagellar L-ring protein precursor FlgH